MANNLKASGVSLSIFSLPSEYGIGTIGKSAKEFIDFLSASGFSYWSILSLGPTSIGDSPFQSFSSRALNFYFIDLDDLIDQDLLKKKDLTGIDWGDDPRKVDYGKIYLNRIKVLKIAYSRFKKGKGGYQRGYTSFLRQNRFLDFACFMVLKEINEDKPWNEFPPEYKEYSPEKFKELKHQYHDQIEFYIWTQYIFLKQWEKLKAYAHEKNISLIGSMPMHVSYDSIDVYKHHRNFILDEDYSMEAVAGYPPDVFYDKGQVWGTPLYDFDYLKRNDYRLFKDRLNFCLSLYDFVVLDHFRGYIENYFLPIGAKDGLNGRWEVTEGKEVVDKFVSDNKRVIAEDVDSRSSTMIEVLSDLRIPDMRVLEFGFPREIGNFNKPTNYPYTCVSFTSTHDCMPLKGYLESLNPMEKKDADRELNLCCRHFGIEEPDNNNVEEQVEALLELNLASLSKIAILAMPDILHQGNESRINVPGTMLGNWRYRILAEDLTPALAKHMLALNKRYGRC